MCSTFGYAQRNNNNNQRQKITVSKPRSTPQSNRISYDAKSNSIVFGSNRYKMVYVSGGSFNMGSTRQDNEKPVHNVTVNGYYIGRTEVTQALWKVVMGNNPSNFKGNNLPVENVSWNDCQKFIEKLNTMTGRTFRLPTEAEWEFAARGGNNSYDYMYSGSDHAYDVAWYDDNSNDETHNVASLQANELGIYDMSGNVWEWCSDWYDENYYKNSDTTNPRGAYMGTHKVLRGGSWDPYAWLCTVSYRYASTPETRGYAFGLRLVYVP